MNKNMKVVISKESVRRANAAMINGSDRGVSMDASHVSVRCRTATHVGTLTFSRDRIVKEANKAFGKMMK